jgi:hypothetical protein
MKDLILRKGNVIGVTEVVMDGYRHYGPDGYEWMSANIPAIDRVWVRKGGGCPDV